MPYVLLDYRDNAYRARAITLDEAGDGLSRRQPRRKD